MSLRSEPLASANLYCNFKLCRRRLLRTAAARAFAITVPIGNGLDAGPEACLASSLLEELVRAQKRMAIDCPALALAQLPRFLCRTGISKTVPCPCRPRLTLQHWVATGMTTDHTGAPTAQVSSPRLQSQHCVLRSVETIASHCLVSQLSLSAI